MLLSNPAVLALNAGTISSSLLSKSSSVILYFSFNIFMIFSFIFSVHFFCSSLSPFTFKFNLFSCEFKSCAFNSFWLSFSSHLLDGMFPITKSNFSPSIASVSFFCIWSFARCGNKSVITKTGSLSFSPIETVIFSPFSLTITPCIARGIVVHWYFFIPP